MALGRNEKTMLLYMMEFYASTGFYPTYDELLALTGRKSKESIFSYMRCLGEEGYVLRKGGHSRDYRLNWDRLAADGFTTPQQEASARAVRVKPWQRYGEDPGAYCGRCGGLLSPGKDMYCRHCGQAILWDATGSAGKDGTVGTDGGMYGIPRKTRDANGASQKTANPGGM